MPEDKNRGRFTGFKESATKFVVEQGAEAVRAGAVAFGEASKTFLSKFADEFGQGNKANSKNNVDKENKK